MADGFFGIPWFAWAGLAAVLGVLFTRFQIPKQTPQTVGLTHFALRWLHAMTWWLLAVSFLIRGLAPHQPGLADVVGYACLVAYVGFWSAFLRSRSLLSNASGGTGT